MEGDEEEWRGGREGGREQGIGWVRGKRREDRTSAVSLGQLCSWTPGTVLLCICLLGLLTSAVQGGTSVFNFCTRLGALLCHHSVTDQLCLYESH